MFFVSFAWAPLYLYWFSLFIHYYTRVERKTSYLVLKLSWSLSSKATLPNLLFQVPALRIGFQSRVGRDWLEGSAGTSGI